MNVIEQCGGSAQKLLQILVQEFPSLRDTAMYKVQTGTSKSCTHYIKDSFEFVNAI